MVLRHWVQELSLAGRFANRTVIVGAGDQGRRLAGYLQRHGDANIRLVGFVDDRATRVAQTNEGLPLLGTVSDLIGLIRRDQVDQVIVALPWTADARLSDIVGRLQKPPVPVRLAPDVAVFSFPNRRLVPVRRLPRMQLFARPPPHTGSA